MRKTRRRGRPKGRVHLRKTNAALAERVRKVGPGRVGILAVDSAKRRFAVLLTDFLGKVLMEQTEVENTGPALQAFVERLAREVRRHGLVDVVVGIERTGRYHVPIAQALKPHWRVEMVDPFATRQLRQPVDPGNKTDGTDLPAIVRAIAVGFGSCEADLPNGPLVGRRNARLRDALIEVAFCLVTCNPYFKGWAEARRARGWPEAKVHVAIATTFARISYRMVAGRQLFDHPCTRGRDAVLWKLADFARRHGIDPAAAQDLLVRAAGQLPREARAQEAEVLRSHLPRRRRRRGSGPQHIRDILPEVIGHLVESVPGRQERPARNPTPEVQGGLLTRRSRD